MIYKNGKTKDIKIAYIGGGSRGWAWRFMSDLALDDEISGTVALYDINHQAAKNNEIIGNKINRHPDNKGDWKYEAVESLQSALTGADFVVISILPGTFDEMASDVHLPERHGIYQSVGDTAGPGGIVRALRTIPMFVEIAEAIKAHAPKSWVINYTNPMTVCMETLYHVFPEIKAFGCCHEVFGTQKVLRDVVEMYLGEEGIKREDIRVNVLGINHFTWFDYASYKGIDLFPIYKDFINKNFEKGHNEKEEHWANSSFASLNRVKMDLFNQYGYIAAAGDRHLAEFVSGDIYLKDPETVASWNFGLTTVDWRKNDLTERQNLSDAYVSGEKEVVIEPSGEEGILLIKALCGIRDLVSNVNIRNAGGQITNLPKEAVVETNALFTRDAIRPLVAGELPTAIYELTKPNLANHKLILKAGLTCDLSVVLEAFKNDPLMAGKLTDAERETLAKDMIRNTLTYLPDGWKAQVEA